MPPNTWQKSRRKKEMKDLVGAGPTQWVVRPNPLADGGAVAQRSNPTFRSWGFPRPGPGLTWSGLECKI